MRILTSLTNDVFTQKLNKNTILQKDKNFPLNTKELNIYPRSQLYSYNINFGLFPWVLNQPQSHSISADEGINLYNKLKLGNYLNIDGDALKHSQREVRKNNLAFLDKIHSENEQKKIINYFNSDTAQKFNSLLNIIEVGDK